MLLDADSKQNRTKGNIVIAMAIAILASILSYWYLSITQTETADPTVTSAADPMPALEKSVPIPPRELIEAAAAAKKSLADNDKITVLDSVAAEWISRLQNEHAHEINDLRFQLSLKGLREDLIKAYPGQGLALFERIINTAFPDLAKSIFELLAKLDIYDQWLVENMLDLNELSLEDQQEALWVKRYEVFGEDARMIWDLTLSPEDERRESMQATVDLLNTAEDVSMEDKLYMLTRAFEDNFSGSYEDFVYDSKGMIAQVFLTFDSVQGELAALEPAARQEQIDDIRRSIGYGEAQIQELAELDQQREARWQNGYAYMNARSELEAQYENGQVPEADLDLLRQEHFKHEASTIKKEEEQLGFFRYTRPRIYGRN